jgi:electron transport complex protein RnfC
MIKRPFFGLCSPKLKYQVVGDLDQGSFQEISLSTSMSLFLKTASTGDPVLNIRTGEGIRTGQQLRFVGQRESASVSTMTGTISNISTENGYLNKKYISISIDANERDQWEAEYTSRERKVTYETVIQFLSELPGETEFANLSRYQASLKSIIIMGMDSDLLVTKNQAIVKSEVENLKKGIEILKEINNQYKIVIIVPPTLKDQASKTGAEVRVIDPVFPNALPKVVMNKVFNQSVSAGKSCEEMGYCFISAEEIVNLARAMSDEIMPIDKCLTVIKKDYSTVNVKARIGTPVSHILETLDIATNHGDRLVLGGPMFGISVYAEETPVQSDTDAIMIQDKANIIPGSNTHCINCGECVRACPAKIPVNMLVRFLENGLWEEAAAQYDLLSCIECGLCSYVCPARIPVFHSIMLGKYEYTRMISEEM